MLHCIFDQRIAPTIFFMYHFLYHSAHHFKRWSPVLCRLRVCRHQWPAEGGAARFGYFHHLSIPFVDRSARILGKTGKSAPSPLNFHPTRVHLATNHVGDTITFLPRQRRTGTGSRWTQRSVGESHWHSKQYGHSDPTKRHDAVAKVRWPRSSRPAAQAKTGVACLRCLQKEKGSPQSWSI